MSGQALVRYHFDGRSGINIKIERVLLHVPECSHKLAKSSVCTDSTSHVLCVDLFY